MCTREIVKRIRIFFHLPYHTIYEVNDMDKDEREKGRQKKAQEEFNNVTNSVKPKNQNQEHNVRKEGIGKQNNKY